MHRNTARRLPAHRNSPQLDAAQRPIGEIMDTSIATVTIQGITPYSQSRQHDEPWLEGESHADYDIRTWRSKLNTERRNGKLTVVIPAHGFMQAIVAAAKYSGEQIKGQGKKTWTAKFAAGIMLLDNPALNIDPAIVQCVTISANADGIRGSGKRVPRRFPEIGEWSSTFDVHILDPIVTEDIFRDMLEKAGMYIGIGRFRPEKGGTNGRFRVTDLVWQDNRKEIQS
jgi:hypothetical protein